MFDNYLDNPCEGEFSLRGHLLVDELNSGTISCLNLHNSKCLGHCLLWCFVSKPNPQVKTITKNIAEYNLSLKLQKRMHLAKPMHKKYSQLTTGCMDILCFLELSRGIVSAGKCVCSTLVYMAWGVCACGAAPNPGRNAIAKV